MRLGSLFSGYGGLDIAVENVLGTTTAWVSDIDKGACKILAHRYPDVPNLGDIAAVNWSDVEPVDILTGGFPCQDLSHAGKRAGLRPDTRSGLWTQMAYAIDQLRPRLVVAENVRGLLSASAHSDMEPCPWCLGDGSAQSPLRALGAVLGDLADLGYDASWYGLRAASDVGACHGRFRVFLVASPQDADKSTRGKWRQPASRQAQGGRPRADTGGRDRAHLMPTPRATDGTKGGPNQRGSSGDLMLPSAVAHLLPTPSAADGSGSGRQSSPAFQRTLPGEARLLPTPTVQDGANNAGPSQFDRNTPPLNAVATTLLPTPSVADALGGHERRGGARSDELLLNGTVKYADFGQYGAAVDRWATILGRPAPAPTEPTGRNDAHRLSPRFVEWMMGLPEGHVTDIPDLTRNEQLKALGNGVVPQQAEAALRLLLPMAVAA